MKLDEAVFVHLLDDIVDIAPGVGGEVAECVLDRGVVHPDPVVPGEFCEDGGPFVLSAVAGAHRMYFSSNTECVIIETFRGGLVPMNW